MAAGNQEILLEITVKSMLFMVNKTLTFFLAKRVVLIRNTYIKYNLALSMPIKIAKEIKNVLLYSILWHSPILAEIVFKIYFDCKFL